MHKIGHKWGKIDPTYMYLSSELVTYFFILLFETVFGRKRSEMVSKKSSDRFYF